MNLIDNQTEEMNVQEQEYLLPDDYVEGEEYDFETETESAEEVEEVEVKEETEESNEESETVEEEQTEESEEVEEDTTETALEDLEVKFLHETKALKDIPREELQAYVQKGMNHDRIQEKLTQAYDQIDDFKDIANMFEMDMQTVIETLKNQYYENKANKEGRQVADVKREYESNKKDRNTKMYERFLDKYPDVKTEDIPQEVMQAVREGEDLVNAYDKYTNTSQTKAKDSEIETLKQQIAELQKKIDVNNQNKKTKKKSVVKKTSNSSGVETDPFLDGLFGEY